MSKLLITADIHFGVPGRLQDILWACRVMREYCAAANIDTVFILGDLFHDRRSLDIEVLSHVSRFFEETVDDYQQKWIVFPGNHDMFLRHSWEINSLTALRKHITVIEDVKIVKVDDTRFWILPFITYEKSYMRVLKAIRDQVQPGDNLLTHIGIHGATMNTCFLLQNWTTIDFEDLPFNRVYTGHFHNKQQIGNVWYPGSPIPFKFDEGDIAHGFYCLDLETDTHKFINIWKAGERFLPEEEAPPQFCTLLDELLPEKTESHIAGNMIRVALQRDYTAAEKQVIKKRLVDLGAKSVRWLDIKQKKTEEETKPDAPQHKDLFVAWYDADKKGHKGLDKKVLFSVHNEVVVEGDELYAVEQTES